MSSSSLANWDGSQTSANRKQSYNGDLRTPDSGGTTSTGTAGNDRPVAYFDAPFMNLEDGRAVWRTGEGNDEGVSSLADIRTKISTISHPTSSVNTSMDITKIFEEEDIVTREIYPESTYSADADGELDGDQARTPSGKFTPPSELVMPGGGRKVEVNIFTPITASNIRKAQYQGLMPYPPPLPELLRSPSPMLDMSSLFTPPPSAPPSPRASPPRPRRRLFLSHVAVPPLPAGRTRSDYIRMRMGKNRVHPVQVHQTLEEALQASLDHNAKVGALHGGSSLHTTRRNRKESNLEQKRPKPQQRNAVAGPSSAPIAGSRQVNTKRVYRKRDREQGSDDEVPRKKPKVHQAEIGRRLTVEDPPRTRSAHSEAGVYSNYDSEEGCLELAIGSIPPVPNVVLSLNTRFALAAACAKTVDQEKENLVKISKKMSETGYRREKSWFIWPPSRPSFLDAAKGEYLAGGPVNQSRGSEHSAEVVEGERKVVSKQTGTKRRTELSPESLEDALRARRNEKEHSKRNIRAVGPLVKFGPPVRSKPKPRETRTKTVLELGQDKPGSPSSAHPPSTNTVPEPPSGRPEKGQEGKPRRESSSKVIHEISPERREGSQERKVSSLDRRRTNTSDAHGILPERYDASQEGMISPHDPCGPGGLVAPETSLEGHNVGQRMVSHPDRHHPREPDIRDPQEPYEADETIISPLGRHPADTGCIATTREAEVMSELHYTSQQNLSPRQPSIKALGKQRASSPLFDTRLGPEPPAPSAQFVMNHDATLREINQQSPYAPAFATGLTPLRTNFFAPSTQQGAAPFLSQVPLNDSDNFLSISLDSPSKSLNLIQSQIEDDGAFLSQSITTHLDGLPTSPEFNEASINPWLVGSNASSSLSDPAPSAVYGDGTINPSLLGGVRDVEIVHFTPPPSPTFSLPSHPTMHSHSPWDVVSLTRSQSARSNSRFRSPTPSSTSSSSSIRPPSQGGSHLSPSLIRRPSLSASEYAETETPTSVSLRPRRPPRHAFRQIPDDMIATSELNSHASSSDEGEPIAKTRVKKSSAVRKIRPPRKQQGPDGESDSESGRVKRSRTKWPLCDTASNCHQCRSTTSIVKLSCPCGRRFCVRCLSTRYEGEFIYNPARLLFTCPRCQNTCNCDVCTRKRGEVYVGLRPRPGGDQQPPQSPALAIHSGQVKSKPKNVPVLNPTLPRARPRSSLGGKTNLPSFSTSATSGPETYWATMYAVTGEKIGRAFVGEDGKDDVVRIRPLQEGRRVFVGAVQPSWGLGSDPMLKDLDPNPTGIKGGPHQRHYIGNKALLYYRTAPQPKVEHTSAPNSEFGNAENNWDFYDDFSSPLSPIEDDQFTGGEGECRQWPSLNESDLGMALQGGIDLFLANGPGIDFSPNSLGDTDVARAITLGLMACGHGIEVKL